MAPAHYTAPRPVVFSGPSGSGKSTLITKLFKEYPTAFAYSISHTTRSPRPGEQNGKEYHFVQRDEMEKMLKNNEFLESTEFSSNLYGTSKKAVEDVANTGKICILDLDKQGVKNIKKTDLNATYIYVSPPSYEILEKRLRDRQTENESAIEKRLQEAKESIEFSKEPGVYHHIVVNDNLEVAYNFLKGLLIKEIDEVTKRQSAAH
ncbi:unnamed protein product [Didymodactylos carnosus]|uniref:guanylate kinase n=1 Tax=Didymodactylos carnosus TaxID=1234261 RepID=A0A814AML8_9BILA|nr:unnamed protein product [Didymodactylos carnosus]CAF0914126.1 unnamed protein product [Didymodactylos carnosus]CAF3530927.1 unnamed protein product [Didymodactylos carnosus]CAF3694629.1 unnamed protein product [Didymodactylos carnosus]